MVVLRNCRLIGALTEGTELTHCDLILDDGKIKQILPVGAEVPQAHQELDVKGNTVMPGLIDMHVHLHMGKSYASDLSAKQPTMTGRVFDCLHYAQELLKLGYTTIRDCGDVKGNPTFALRDAIEEGIVVGPRVLCSGLTICPHERGITEPSNGVEFIAGPMEMRKAVRKIISEGSDLVKIYGSGSMLSPGSLAELKILEEDEIQEAAKIAISKGTYAACHCHSAEAINICAKAGIRTMEHASFISEETCRFLSGKEDQGIVITLACTEPEVNALDGYSEAVQERFRTVCQRVYGCLKKAYEHNVLIGWGTDCSLDSYVKYPYSEFKARKERLGFPAIDILKQATINSAKLLDKDDLIGTVKEGKYADLIVVEGNPDEDISAMYVPPIHVIKNGDVIR